MDKQQLHLYCLEWVKWCKSRKYFAPPVPANIMAKLSAPAGGGTAPDAECSPDMQFFNGAVHGLAEIDRLGALCFITFYYHRAGNIKALASEMKISRKTYYEKRDAFRDRAYRASMGLKRTHQDYVHHLPAAKVENALMQD